MKPLAPRQVEILKYLKAVEDADKDDPLYADKIYRYPASPAHIAMKIGMDDLPTIHANKGWSGTASMNPAQRIISSLTGLSRRGLIRSGRRPDGYSGAAYSITDEGRAAVE